MDIELSCDSIGSVKSSSGYRGITVSLEGIDKSEIIGQFTVKDFIDYFSLGDILKEIPIQQIIDHHGEEEIFEHLDLDPNFQNIK